METNSITIPRHEYKELVELKILHEFLLEYVGYNKLSGEEVRRLHHAAVLFINEGHCDTGDVSRTLGGM
jgi:hypothetical protein